LDPHRIIDVAELVNVLGLCRESKFEWRRTHCTCVRMNP
jgi:hypothetical protein